MQSSAQAGVKFSLLMESYFVDAVENQHTVDCQKWFKPFGTRI